MASSSEAFAKFSTWKNLRTSLRVTVIDRGKPEDILSGRIDALDPDAPLVGMISGGMYVQFPVAGAVFSVEPDRVVVSRDDLEWLIFEEDD
ncbi:MAG: hypothetical protein ABSB60_09070 [Terracidiphilus sp.]|jgi:hypothetical protein